LALPFLDLLLARDGALDAFVLLEPDQVVDFVLLRETFNLVVLVLPYPLDQV